MFKSLPIQLVQEESDDLIQLINPEQDSDLKPEDLPGELSILPIKNTVLFPGVVIPITVGRQKSIKLVKKAYQGKNRFLIKEFIQEEPYLTARIELQQEPLVNANSKEAKALVQSLKDAATKILKLNPEIPIEAQVALDNISSMSFLVNFLSSNLNAEVGEKQKILETQNLIDRSTLLLQYMLKDI